MAIFAVTMPRDLISRYVWIVDTLTRYERLTRQQLNKLWVRSALSKGEEMPERTFFNYRRAIEENFQIDILCDKQGRYYIHPQNSRQTRAFTNWMLDSYAVSSAIKGSDAPMDRVEIEDVPSAREFLPAVLDAIRNSHRISFTYAGFNRSRAEHDIRFHPYFLKRYKQRWYMIGLKEKSNDIRTYALDRVKEMVTLDESFEKPADLELNDLFGNIIGVTTSQAPVRTVRLQTTPRQAKYFRALPLHPSQQETIHDDYSIFTYQLKLNYELAHEILALGDAVKVLDPPELKAMVITQLQAALNQYDS
ncbi:MAG: WYL domain-containing protein [Muribaculaceae bacterium]|nr:WYL domain-containing protein [Muribaculaceae bacterium]